MELVDVARPRQFLMLAVLLSGMALVLFVVSLAPTVGWGDSADLAMRMVDSSDSTFRHGTRDYVMYRWVGQAFQLVPVGDAGTRANLMTAVFGALTVGIVSLYAGFMTGSRAAMAAAGIALAVSHTFWFLSVTAEVYTFGAALVFGAFLSILSWQRYRSAYFFLSGAFFAGLSLSHHVIGLFMVFAVVPVLFRDRKAISLRLSFAAVVLWLLGAGLYWYRVFMRFNDGDSIREVLGLLPSTNPFYSLAPFRESLKFGAYLVYNFPGAALLFIVLGALAGWKSRRPEWTPPVIWALLLVAIGVTSEIPDKHNIYVLAYPTLAILVGVGFNQWRVRSRPRLSWQLLILVTLFLLPIVSYAATVRVTRIAGIDLAGARNAPYRENQKYFLWPPKTGDFGPRRYAEEALSSLDYNSILIADYTLWRPLLFLQQVESVRPDVEIRWVERILWDPGVLGFLQSVPSDKTVYLAWNQPADYYQLDQLYGDYDLLREGVVFRVEPRTGGISFPSFRWISSIASLPLGSQV